MIMVDQSRPSQGLKFTLEVEGILDPRWAEWFDEYPVSVVQSATNAARTLLIVTLPDQSALSAVLARVTGLNLKIASVRPGEPAGPK
jgi:hypothetical protein